MVVVRRLVLILAIGLVAAACGSDSSSDVADSSTTSSSAPTTTAPTQDAGGDGSVAQEGDFVAVHYIGTLDDGSVFDESRPRGATLDFTIGAGQMIAGFDEGVRGMTAGETKTIRIEPADAYGGEFLEADISQVPEGTVGGDTLFDAAGQAVEVVSVEGNVVTLRNNHELAGQTLNFEIEMVAINP